jgi:hypothetical protein
LIAAARQQAGIAVVGGGDGGAAEDRLVNPPGVCVLSVGLVGFRQRDGGLIEGVRGLLVENFAQILDRLSRLPTFQQHLPAAE